MSYPSPASKTMSQPNYDVMNDYVTTKSNCASLMNHLSRDGHYRNYYSENMKQRAYAKMRQEVKEREYERLTDKYGEMIWKSIERAALKGKTSKYINLNNEDFQINFPGLTDPVKFKRMWIKEVMKNTYSKHHKKHPVTQSPYDIEGIYTEVWGNSKGTVHFSWSDQDLYKETGGWDMNKCEVSYNYGWEN